MYQLYPTSDTIYNTPRLAHSQLADDVEYQPFTDAQLSLRRAQQYSINRHSRSPASRKYTAYQMLMIVPLLQKGVTQSDARCTRPQDEVQ